MWLALFAVLVVLLALWVLQPSAKPRSQGFQESCQLQTTSTLPTDQVQALISHTTEQINSEVARFTEPVKIGMITVRGIGNARLTEITVGKQSQVLRCTSACVCQKSEHFPQGAALRLVGATASVVAPNIEVTFLGGLGKVTTTIEATVRGVDAVIESDCKQDLVITAIDLQEVEITKPDQSTMLGKLLAKVPQQREQLLSGLRSYVLNKIFTLPATLADTPLLCKEVKASA
jgi:hypothetical protein